jgi:hypothetical protein
MPRTASVVSTKVLRMRASSYERPEPSAMPRSSSRPARPRLRSRFFALSSSSSKAKRPFWYLSPSYSLSSVAMSGCSRDKKGNNEFVINVV